MEIRPTTIKPQNPVGLDNRQLPLTKQDNDLGHKKAKNLQLKTTINLQKQTENQLQPDNDPKSEREVLA